jgi:hypothetical protein
LSSLLINGKRELARPEAQAQHHTRRDQSRQPEQLFMKRRPLDCGRWRAKARAAQLFPSTWLNLSGTIGKGVVTVVSHFQGGRTPDSVREVGEGGADLREKGGGARGRGPRGISPPLSELAKIRLRLPNRRDMNPGNGSSTADMAR